MACEIERRPHERYTPEQIDRGLLEVAVCGNAALASKRLAAEGLEIDDRLLRMWRSEIHAGRYAEIAAEQAPKIEATIVEAARRIAQRAAEIELKALDRTEEQLDAGDVKDPAAVARNLAVAKAVNIDKTLTLESRPSQISEVRRPEEIIRSLEKLGVLKAIDGTAEEEPSSPRPDQVQGTKSEPERSEPTGKMRQ